MARSLWVYGNGVISELLQANHLAQPLLGLAQGLSWWHMLLSAKVDFRVKDSGRSVVSSLPLAPPKCCQLVFRAAPCSLSGPPVVRQLMQVAITVPGQGGWFHHCSPNISAINGAGILWKPGRETPLSSLGVREGGEGSKER